MDKLKKFLGVMATNKMKWITLVVGMLIIIATALAVYLIEYEKTKASTANANTTDEEVNIIQQENLVNTSEMSEEELQKLNEEEQKEAEEEEQEENEKKTTTTTSTTKSKYYIKVNYGAQVVTIYTYDTNGNYTVPVRACICSTGAATPTSGVYKISWKATWGLLYGNVWGHYCCRIVGDILFHSVPYKQAANDTLVSTYYDRLGSKDSMGCIRLTTADAKWIYENCASGTQVEFYSSSNPGPLGKPTAIKVSDAPGDLKNWDPTDPDPDNPWIEYLKEQNSAENTNTEVKNTETTDNETVNNEATNSATQNTESTNIENTNIENTSNANSESQNTETADNETVNNATTNSATQNTSNTNIENTNIENTNSGDANAEDTNGENTSGNNTNNENAVNNTNGNVENNAMTNTQNNGI